MSYLLDIFNKRQPAPTGNPAASAGLNSIDPSGPNLWQRPMTMPSGGPNTGTPMPPALDSFVGMSVPPMDVATAIASGIGIPPSQINRGPGGNAQNNPMPQMGGGMPAFNLPPNFSLSGPQQMPNPGMGGVSQMPAFQPPQPMPFNNRPMPQFGAPNFSLQGGMTAAPQPSPMNGMMKGMFGVR